MRLRLERVRDQIQRKYFCERGLGREANSEVIIEGTGTSLEGGACGFTSIDEAAVSACCTVSSCATVVAAASLSALHSFRRTTARYSISHFLIFWLMSS